MKLKCIIALLALLPFSGYCHDDSAVVIPHLSIPTPDHTVESIWSNENDFSIMAKKAKRSVEVPTHIIRSQGVVDKPIYCDEVTKFINEKVLLPLVYENFTYNMYVTCTYDKSTNYATHFYINSYFDPLSDDAVAFLNQYLTEVNGMDLFGTPLQIEAAKSLIVSNNLMAGIMKKPNRPPFIVHRQDRSNFSFKSNYEMATVMLTDVYANFYSDDADKILPFLNRWIYPTAGFSYYYVLLDSNYVEFQPERIFLMEKDGDIFVSNLRYYFGHLCHKHDHGHCVRQSLQ